MGRECGPIPVLWMDGDLPIPTVTVQCGEYGSIAQRVNTLVHPGKRIRVGHRDGIEPAVVDTEPQGAIRPGYEHDRGRPLRVRRFTDSLLQHLVDFDPFYLPSSGTGMDMVTIDRWRRSKSTIPNA
jgi:hypothetical protein